METAVQDSVQDAVQSPSTPPRQAIHWGKGFELFCQRMSFRAIAAELRCTPTAVWDYAKRANWVAKRQTIEDKLPKGEAIVGTDGVVTQLITYQATQLAKVDEQTSIAEEQITLARVKGDGQTVATLLRCLDMLADRKRILLGIPLPGVRRQDAGGRRQRTPSLPVIDVSDKPTT